MASTNRSLLATASLAALLTAGANGAMAQVRINGGGSSLGYPTYLAEFTDLYTLNKAYIFANGKVSQGPVVSYYGSVGSGKGTAAFLTNDATLLNGGGAGKYKNGTTIVSVPAPNFTAGTPVHYGASDALLASTDVTNYNASAVGRASGPLIQVPAYGVSVAIPFNDGSATTATLTEADLCGIYSGRFTNWNQTSSRLPAGPITVIFRGDGSGTSFLFTNHLATVCGGGFTAGDYFAGNFATLPSNFLPATGSGGVQAAFLAIQNATSFPITLTGTYLTSKTAAPITVTRTITSSSEVAYIGPDFTSIAPNSPNTSSAIKVASIVNRNSNVAERPTVDGTRRGLNTSAAPPSTLIDAKDPTKWVPLNPNPSAGYPIVGFTNLILSQCYSNSTVTTGIKAFLQNQYNNATFATDIANSGFVTVPNVVSANYVSRINGTFLANTFGYNLNIGQTGVCRNGGSSGTYVGR